MSIYDSNFVVLITYQGTAEDRFDRKYYDEGHLPLVMRSWSKYGLISATAYYPSVEQTGTIAICECVFRDEAAVEKAFSSPEAPEVMADVQNFTDIEPVRLRALPY